MRRFKLRRDIDESGLSGTGDVVEGVQFWNGQVAITWRSPQTVVSVFPNIEVFERVHMRDTGSLHWIDEEHVPEPPSVTPDR